MERLEAERWEKLRARAAEWHEAQQLRAFLTALETGRDDLASEVDGLPLSEWLDWARQRITKFDPLA